MMILLALALSSAATNSSTPDWRPSGCTSSDRLSQTELRAAKSEAKRGNISASVSLECHYLALGQQAEALRWLRQSADREPLTGQRYINYLLSLGGKENCREAYERAEKYLALKWDFPKLNQSLHLQWERANECR